MLRRKAQRVIHPLCRAFVVTAHEISVRRIIKGIRILDPLLDHRRDRAERLAVLFIRHLYDKLALRLIH